jgi:hypothetical protein
VATITSRISTPVVFGRQAWKEVREHQFIGADAADRRQRSMKDMVKPPKRTCFLYRDQIVRLFDDADNGAVALGIGAV